MFGLRSNENGLLSCGEFVPSEEMLVVIWLKLKLGASPHLILGTLSA